MTPDEWEQHWGGKHPGRLIDPWACKECGTARHHHGRQWTSGAGVHSWIQPTARQIKYRMIRRRKHHEGTRWR